MGQIYQRKLSTVQTTLNGVSTYRIDASGVIYGIALTLAGQLLVAAADNTAANTRRGDEWGIIKNIRLFAGSELRVDLSGDELWWLNRQWFGQSPRLSTQLGDTTVTNAAFGSTLVLPFFTPGAVRPHDTLLNPANYDQIRLEVTWGDAKDINANATNGFAGVTQPSLNLHIAEDSERVADGKVYVPRYILRREIDASGANSALDMQLSTDRTFFRLHLNTRDTSTPALDDGGVLNSLKLISGAREYYSSDYSTARDMYNLIGEVPTGLVLTDTADVYRSVRVNTANKTDGWASLGLAYDGSYLSGIATYGLSTFKATLNVAKAGKIVAIEESAIFPTK